MTKKITKKKENGPQKGPLFYLGNLLIISSLLMAFIIFYPVISTYFFPPQIKEQSKLTGDYITVPKIKAQAPLVLNVDPRNESVYKNALKKGVAHAKGTYLPGEKGRSFLFAHSSGNPLEQTNFNTVFLKLGNLKIGDDILIKRGGKDYKYKVTSTKIVWPSEVEYLEKKEIPGIVVQTCWPIGTSIKRLLVFASPVE
jgi:LPXTG-site transpeptidase (sortase) family protein